MEIKDPITLDGFKGKILISSALYAEAIKKQIFEMGLDNESEILKWIACDDLIVKPIIEPQLF